MRLLITRTALLLFFALGGAREAFTRWKNRRHHRAVRSRADVIVAIMQAERQQDRHSRDAEPERDIWIIETPESRRNVN